MPRHQGKVVFVTGAAQGLGKDIAAGFAAVGAKVIMADKSEAVSATAKELESTGAQVRPMILDVRSEVDFRNRIQDAVDWGGRLDVLINNAAVTVARSVWDITTEEWDDVLAVNLRSAFYGCRIAGQRMRDQGVGRIINISSMAGQRGGVVGGVHYSSSKAGMIVLTKVFAAELAASGVTVNCIAPAAIRTPAVDVMPKDKVEALAAQIPVRRFGEGGEVAEACLYLASPKAGFVTGATLDINGGVFMR